MATNGSVAQDSLTQKLAQIAMMASADYLESRRITLDRDQTEALTTALQSRIVDAIMDGLRDAREALDAGMGEPLAQATLVASVRLAGIRAAQDVVEVTA